MKFLNYSWLLLIYFFSSFQPISGQLYELKGKVFNADNNEALIGANIQIKGHKGTITNEHGSFLIQLPKGTYVVRISYLGFQPLHDTLQLYGPTEKKYALKEGSVVTDEVVIQSTSNRLTESVEPGMVQISGKDLDKLPALLGEPDIMHAIKLSPGVQSAGDGNTGFYVRGGSADQNGIYLDNSTVYNPSHVLGFISVFNADIIENTSLIKSGMPANYGGRLSSVINIKTKAGNMQDYHGSFTVGLISSKLYVEGPIVKEKLSFMASVRRSYLDEIIKPAFQLVSDTEAALFNNSQYHFYDINAKLNFQINTNNYLSAHFYQGTDKYSLRRTNFGFSNGFDWGNTIFGLNSYHNLKNKWFLKNTLYITRYNFNFAASQNDIRASVFSGIHEYAIKSTLSGKIGDFADSKTGFEVLYREFFPNNVNATASDVELDFGTNTIYKSLESSLFLNTTIPVAIDWTVSAGIRYTNYMHLGPYTEFLSEQEDTIVYNNHAVVKSYNVLEPRLSVKYSFHPDYALKLAYTRNNQFIHQAPTANVTLPVDVWITSSKEILPQAGDQYSAGLFVDFTDNLRSSIDFYYKDMDHLVELTAGIIDNFSNKNIEDNLAEGRGWSYGAEMFTEWTNPKHNFSSSITLSRTLRQFEEFKQGRIYPAKYDRLLDMKLSYAYTLSEKLQLNSVFVFASGEALTLPNGWALLHENLIINSGEKNAFRLPPYHRLDLSLVWNLKAKQQRDSELIFSVFNVYNRPNPFYIYFVIDYMPDNRFSIQPKQVSLFPILPSIAWRYKF
ncbi:MAG: TonB-dependent receptor plug domain-containing protein [Bacteroidetes bacterium]|nr:TonB-dependent receptor plug domain-containing protein [Bacteroidota bacterium]